MWKSPIVRKATVADADKISALIVDAAGVFSADPSGAVAPWFLLSISPQAIADNIRNVDFSHFVATMDEAIVGVIAIRDNSHIHHLFVASAYHRRGIATALWQRARTEAIAAGNKGGFSVRTSEFALPVYERFGFRVIGAREIKNGIAFVPMHLEHPSLKTPVVH